jgi:hypothetical protein
VGKKKNLTTCTVSCLLLLLFILLFSLLSFLRLLPSSFFVLSSSVLFLSFHRDTVRQRERVGSRGEDRERESETGREIPREGERCIERSGARERVGPGERAGG